MNRIYKFLIALFATVCLTSSAMAFSGVSVGVMFSDNDLDTYGTEHERGDATNGDDEMASTSKSASEEVASIFVEYTTPQGTTFGAEYFPGEAVLGSGSRTDTTTADADAGTSSVDYTAKAEVKDIISLYVEPTYMVNDMFGVYGKVGATNLKVLSLENIDSGDNSANYPDDDVWGSMLGLGVKAVSPIGLFIKLETMEYNFEPIEMVSSTGNGNMITADLDIQSFRAAIGYNF
tara:strand:+ start:334 stop:1035 length:702 start_codon:yes stop_codon:yes gene_type:complete